MVNDGQISNFKVFKDAYWHSTWNYSFKIKQINKMTNTYKEHSKKVVVKDPPNTAYQEEGAKGRLALSRSEIESTHRPPKPSRSKKK